MRAAIILAGAVFVGALALAFADPGWEAYGCAGLIAFWGFGSILFQGDWGGRRPPN